MTTKAAHAAHAKEIEDAIDAGCVVVGVNVTLTPEELEGYPEAVITIKVEQAAATLTAELTRAVERYRAEQEAKRKAEESQKSPAK